MLALLRAVAEWIKSAVVFILAGCVLLVITIVACWEDSSTDGDDDDVAGWK